MGVTLARAEHMGVAEPREWFMVERHDVRYVMMICPHCNRGISIAGMPWNLHHVKPDGTVHPSLVCPYKDCVWHEFIRLEGWPP